MAGHAESVAPLVVRVVVPCPCDRAFDYFTQDIGTGWPLATHSVGRADAARCAFEPRIGGRLVETTRHGAEHVWGDRGPAMRTEYGSGWQAVLRERFTAHVYAGEMR